MMKYIIAVLGALLICALCGAKALYDSRAAVVVSLNEAIAARSAAEGLLGDVRTQVQREKARADANRSLLRNALKENAEWAAAATPPAVVDSLCQPPAKCSRSPGSVR